MHRHAGGIGRSLGRRWSPIVALLLVLAPVGHDLLMGAGAHVATASDHHGAAIDRRHPTISRDGLAAHVEDRSAGVSSTRGGCGVGQRVARRGDDPAPEQTALVAACSLLGEAGSDTRGGSEALPGLSPRTRRTLLQVYRI